MKAIFAILLVASVSRALAEGGDGGPDSTPKPGTAAPAAHPAAAAVDAREAASSAFVHKVYVHGVPYDEAKKLGASSVPHLVRMLGDLDEEPWWPNIVITIGMIGAPDGAPALISFVESGNGLVSTHARTAKLTAVAALGYIVNQSGDLRALTYLRDGVDPAVWADRGLRWYRAPLQRNARNTELARMSIIGLGISGRAESRTALKQLRNALKSDKATPSQRTMAPLVDQAIVEHEKISRNGLDAYHQRPNERAPAGPSR